VRQRRTPIQYVATKRASLADATFMVLHLPDLSTS
jgi:hypothetical protein